MNTNFIKETLYTMKIDYGTIIRYITIIQSDVQIETGIRDIIKNVYDFNAVVLPRKLTRKFIQDIGYLAANKNFTYGALNDYNEIVIIIDPEDLPRNLQPELNGYIIYQGKRYEKTEFELFGENAAYILKAKGAEGGKPYDIMSLRVHSNFQLQTGVNCELN